MKQREEEEGYGGVRVEWKVGVGVTSQGNKSTQCQWTEQNHHHRCFKFRILMVIGMKERLYRLRFAKRARSRLPEGNIKMRHERGRWGHGYTILVSHKNIQMKQYYS